MTTIAAGLGTKQNTLTTSSNIAISHFTTGPASSTMSGSLRIQGGQGRENAGANLRLTGTGDSVYNMSACLWGNSNVDLHQWELSWAGYNHFFRPNASTAWAQTMGVSLTTGAWVHYKGLSAASDRSLKDDLQDANTEQCLSMLRQVSAKTYVRKDLPDSGSRLGFVAEAAGPPLWSNVISTSTYAWAQAPEGAEIKVLDYARLTSVLWQCTRSLLARVEQLEMRLAQ